MEWIHRTYLFIVAAPVYTARPFQQQQKNLKNGRSISIDFCISV